MLWNVVKVKVTQNKTTPVKYRYLKNLLKYSNKVKLLRYCPPLPLDGTKTLSKSSAFQDALVYLSDP